METRFTPDQLKDPRLKEADDILRRCVHCGLCNATCPTYLLLGDERDGPRGRIYLIKAMLEGEAAPKHVRPHLDRCLSCYACMTACPGGVDYRHLSAYARQHIEQNTARGRRMNSSENYSDEYYPIQSGSGWPFSSRSHCVHSGAFWHGPVSKRCRRRWRLPPRDRRVPGSLLSRKR